MEEKKRLYRSRYHGMRAIMAWLPESAQALRTISDGIRRWCASDISC